MESAVFIVVLACVGIIGIIGIGAAVFFLLRNNKKDDKRKNDLRKRGMTAPASIISARINSRSKGSGGYKLHMTFEIDVQPESGTAFKTTFYDSLSLSRVEYEALSNDASEYTGRKIWVTYDPNHIKDMMFEHFDSDHEWILKRTAFERMDKRNEGIRKAGEQALAVILEVEDLKITNVVERDHLHQTIMRLKLEIIPKNGLPYQAETQAIFANTSLPAYSVGKKVYVKFNPQDNTQVVLSGSAN